MAEPQVEMAGEVLPDLPQLTPDQLASMSPEEKDSWWLKNYYQGDDMPQLTLRAVIMGGLLGMLMSLSNLYTTVKLGWAFGVAITACVLSFVIWNAIRALSGKKLSQMSILETNCMASTASAAGYSTGGTVGTAFGALLLIQGHHISWHVLAPFVLLTAALGVFLAIPMKRQMINQEQLPFPSGIAAAVTLKSLYSEGKEAMQKATSLVIALLAGMFLAFMRTYEGMVEALHNVGKAPEWLVKTAATVKIPDLFPFPTRWLLPKGTPGTVTGWGFEPSALLVAAGMIVGLRVSLSMLVGSVLLYCVFVPWMYARDVAHKGVEGFVASFNLAPNGDFNPLRWGLWAGTSVMVFSSLTVVAIQWKTIVRAFKIGKGGGSAGGERARIEVPGSWLVIGLVPIGLGMIILQYFAFHMSWYLGLISVVMSFPLGLVACRATGETDTTPIGAMGKVTQLMYAVLAKGNQVVNLTSAGVTAASAGASADLLTDLKSGYMLGANPRKQFLAQFFGCFFGSLAIVPAWYLMFPTKEVLESYNPPAPNMWKAVAEALTKGLHTVPVSAQLGIVIGGLIGIAMPIVEWFLPPKARKYFPSATGLGLAWVVPFQNALSFALGAVITMIWSRMNPKQTEKYNVPIASGLVAGESLMAAVVAIACTVIGLIWAKPG